MPHECLWILEHMLESAQRAAEIASILDQVPQTVEFKIK